MRFESPQTTKDAAALLAGAKGKGRVLAGGTDLLVQMKSGMVAPDLIVDIKRIPAMKAIKAEKGGMRIGGGVPSAEMSEHAALSKGWPGVVESADLIGSTQIQGRATLAGNLCNASPAADSVPAMVAIGAKARVVGAKKRRDVLVEKIVTGPGKTSLAKDELVESILLPKRPPRSGDAYLRFIPRTEMDIAVAGAAVSLSLDTKGVCTDARVILGAVGPRIIDAKAAAKALIGSKVDKAALKKMEEACSAVARPIDDKRGTKEFRKHVVGVLARRAAQIALKRAKGSK
ncbi:MAG: xanthine dehydrogenase family protein subunit M [Rhodospirillaceae bacterium]|jgi:aerobic carbon-monoxide dehydrogenase medium subunit|nr:xanthine dehydrogenase family protein subunit M [Rhodospirillaceae bacterium]MBT6118835.1 xanthine dehydrogenase family protein subunit M [Rhodospirillaceae bacterium]